MSKGRQVVRTDWQMAMERLMFNLRNPVKSAMVVLGGDV